MVSIVVLVLKYNVRFILINILTISPIKSPRFFPQDKVTFYSRKYFDPLSVTTTFPDFMTPVAIEEVVICSPSSKSTDPEIIPLIDLSKFRLQLFSKEKII